MDQSYLDHLNAQQRKAVIYGLNRPGKLPPPLLIIAGAGTGKTATLAHRLAHIVVCGGDPAKVLLMTFTRRAATEMVERATRLVSKVLKLDTSIDLPWAGTFHSIGARLLREYATTIGLSPNFNVHDRSDSTDLMDLVRHELELTQSTRRFPKAATCLAIYSMIVNTRGRLEEVLSAAFPWCEQWIEELRTLFAAYVKAKQFQHVLDFDDLLLYWSHMMKIPDIAEDVADRFDYVLIDEYQDTNLTQSDILLNMKPSGEGVTVVGDDAQSIYRFRAAQVENILTFPTAFKPTAKVIALEQNYRSSQPILDAANVMIALAEKRYTKNLWCARTDGEKPRLVVVRDDADQARYVSEVLLANREAGNSLKQQAVLFRASHHSGQLEIELSRRNIPYVKYGGLRFMDAAHIKDVICILRWAQNMRDRVSGFRVLKLLPGFGPAKAGRLIDTLAVSRSPLEDIQKYTPPMPAKQYWADFLALLGRLRAPMLGWPADMSLIREWYTPLLDGLYDDPKGRMADILQLEQIAATFPTRDKFITELTLDAPDAASKQSGDPKLDEDYVILSTIHSAKGLEFSRVFILSCIDGCFPSDLAAGEKETIEEERRLLYVGMTRARNSLTLLLPQNFYTHRQPARGARHIMTSRTRFIPDSIIDKFELDAWPTTSHTPSRYRLSPAVDIGAIVNSEWVQK